MLWAREIRDAPKRREKHSFERQDAAEYYAFLPVVALSTYSSREASEVQLLAVRRLVSLELFIPRLLLSKHLLNVLDDVVGRR